MKKALFSLLLTLLICTNCRRKSSNSITTSDQPPDPPGSAQDSTNSQSLDTTTQTAYKFSFIPQKQSLEEENIGIIFKEINANILSVYVNICGGNNVFGVTFDLNYDSTNLIFKSVKNGDFLNKDGKNTELFFNDPIVAITRIDWAVGGVSGDGTICIIELEAKKTFDSLNIGFKNQSATNLDSSNWFGAVLGYK